MIVKFKIFEDINNVRRFVIDTKNHRFQLFLGDNLVSETYYNVETPDELFKKEYVGIFKLKTYEEYRGKGFMRYLLEQIFDYVKNNLKIDNILLNVYKSNINALNLYISSGFEIYKELDDEGVSYFTLIKKL